MPATWSSFRRRDLSPVIRIVAEVAASADPGAYGHGVEVVVESPRLHWWNRFGDRAARDQARIAVTGPDGTTGYPIHVRLVTGYGPKAVARVHRRDGWATSVTSMTAMTSMPSMASVPAGGGSRSELRHPHESGEAILMLKRGTLAGYERNDAAVEVAEGTVAALDDLHSFSPQHGWRVRIDRHVRRN